MLLHNPQFYLYPLRFEERKSSETNKGLQLSAANAAATCAEVGDGWRLPNANELILSYIYRDVLGGVAAGGGQLYESKYRRMVYQ